MLFDPDVSNFCPSSNFVVLVTYMLFDPDVSKISIPPVILCCSCKIVARSKTMRMWKEDVMVVICGVITS
jgi:hypothetical protein